MKNILIGFIAALVVALVAYFGFLKSAECPQCPQWHIGEQALRG